MIESHREMAKELRSIAMRLAVMADGFTQSKISEDIGKSSIWLIETSYKIDAEIDNQIDTLITKLS